MLARDHKNIISLVKNAKKIKIKTRESVFIAEKDS